MTKDARFVRDLELIAEWRDELQKKIKRAELRFQTVGLPDEEMEALAHEVATYKEVCGALRAERWGE